MKKIEFIPSLNQINFYFSWMIWIWVTQTEFTQVLLAWNRISDKFEKKSSRRLYPRKCSLLNTFAFGVPIMLIIPIKNQHDTMIYAFWNALEMVHYYYEYFMFSVDKIADIPTCFSIRLHDLTVLVSIGIKTFSLIWQA